MGAIFGKDDSSKQSQTSNTNTTDFLADEKMNINDFTFLAVSGKGSFGRIMKVRKNDNGLIYALKVIKKKTFSQQTQKELNIEPKRQILSRIDHPFIVSLRYFFQSETKIFLVLDFFKSSGALSFHLKNEGRFNLKRSKLYCGEIYLALKYLHSNSIIYGDLKPEYVLIDDEGHIKITDFHVSKNALKNDIIMHTFCGDISEYLAPEIMHNHDQYDEAIDWWSFGVLLYNMLTGLPPRFSGNDKQLDMPKYLSHEANSMCRGLLQIDPKKRFRSTHIETHVFFKDIDRDKLYNKKSMYNRYKLHVKEYNNGISVSKVDEEFTEEIPVDILVDKTGSMLAAKDMFKGFTYKPPKVIEKNVSYDTIIALDDILNGNDETINLLKRCLIARGWAKIKYPESVNIVIKDVMNSINKWLVETDINKKLKYSLKLNSGKPNPQSDYGYHTINGFKEGIRVLTGDIYKIHCKNNKYPSEIMDDILKINNIFDDLSVKILKIIYNKIFSLEKYEDFGTMYDISLLNYFGKDKFKFSMLDFVNYFNDKEYIEKIRDDTDEKMVSNALIPNVLKTDFNVFEHSDPGLFILSFSSTNIGLEMYDCITHKWIKIGLNEGMWWNGNTAANIDSNIKVGKHRVMIDTNQYKPRFTGWYEVSCNKQLNHQIMKEAVNMNMNGE